MKVIIISGTPGTGKTTLANRLAEKLKFKKLNLKSIINKLEEGYDRKKQCYVVDVKKLNKEVIGKLKGEKKKGTRGIVISSHLIHNLPSQYVDLCIITKCSDLKKLKKRLVSRKYSKKKVEENLECEIFDVCLEQSKKKGHKILVVDTSKKFNEKELVRKVEKNLRI